MGDEEKIMVRCECNESTAADIEYFEQGRQYTIDMKWAQGRGIWRYFDPLEEIPAKRHRERVADEKPATRRQAS